MRIFSPSQVEAYFRDPLFWSLEYEARLEPKFVGKKALAAALGAGFAAGVAAWRRAQVLGADPTAAEASAHETGMKRLAHELNLISGARQVIFEGDSEYRESMPMWLKQGIEKYILHNPAPKDWKIRDVELSLTDYGYAKIDVGFETPDGSLVVWDDKFKVTLEQRYRHKEISKYDHDWKNLHYAWAYSQFQGSPVHQYVVCITVLQPKSLPPIIVNTPIDPELMALWESSSKQVWADMEACSIGTRLPYCKFQFQDGFGRHDYADAVLKYRLHEHLMADGYVRKEKR